MENKVNPPRPPTLNSIPSLLSTLQSEWDSLILETHTLRQQYINGRKDLAHALYQVDAAHRVIARLMLERDQARDALSNIQANLGVTTTQQPSEQTANNDDVDMKDDSNSSIPNEVLSNIDTVAAELSSERKKRKIPEGVANIDEVKSFKNKESLPSFHSSSPAGVTSTDISKDGNLLLTGGNDKHVQIYDRTQSKSIATLKGHTKKVNTVEFREKDGHNPLVISGGDKRVRVYGEDQTKGWKLQGEFKNRSSGEVTDLKVHPTKDYILSVGTDQQWSFHDVTSLDTVIDVGPQEGENGDFEYRSMDIHPDGQIFGTGTQSGICRIWDIRSGKIAANFESPSQASNLNSLSFSENGYYLAGSFESSPVVEIFDLRKLKSVHSIQFEDGISSPLNVKFDPSAQFLAVGGHDVRIFTNKKWDEISRFEDNANLIQSLSWGVGSHELITSGLDRTVRFYGAYK